MLQCLLKEWRHAKSKHGITGASTIFFGGGTPSLMPLRLIETLVEEIAGGMEVNKTDQLFSKTAQIYCSSVCLPATHDFKRSPF